MKESPVKIDALLEPLLLRGDDDHADELVLELINVHAEPVIKGVIRFKLRLSCPACVVGTAGVALQTAPAEANADNPITVRSCRSNAGASRSTKDTSWRFTCTRFRNLR